MSKETPTPHVTQEDLDEAATKFMSAIHNLTQPIPENETEEQKKNRKAVARALARMDDFLWTDWK